VFVHMKMRDNRQFQKIGVIKCVIFCYLATFSLRQLRTSESVRVIIYLSLPDKRLVNIFWFRVSIRPRPGDPTHRNGIQTVFFDGLTIESGLKIGICHC
jgi:hypothetical protein